MCGQLYAAVIKTTGSAFENFIRDEYTTLAEVGDRIFSTSVDLQYTFSPLPIDPTKLGTLQYDKIAASARTITLEVFATDESASVQVRCPYISHSCRQDPIRSADLLSSFLGDVIQNGPANYCRAC